MCPVYVYYLSRIALHYTSPVVHYIIRQTDRQTLGAIEVSERLVLGSASSAHAPTSTLDPQVWDSTVGCIHADTMVFLPRHIYNQNTPRTGPRFNNEIEPSIRVVRALKPAGRIAVHMGSIL